MAVYQSEIIAATSGGTTSIDTRVRTPLASSIRNPQIRWRGKRSTSYNYSTSSAYGVSGGSSGGESQSSFVQYPAAPVGYSFYCHNLSGYVNSGTSGNWELTFYYSNSGFGSGGSVSATLYSNRTGTNEGYMGYHQYNYSYGFFISTTGYQVSYIQTQNPAVTVAGLVSQYVGVVNNGVWTNWQELRGFVKGPNTLLHSIAGSQQADFQIQYEYSSRRRVASVI